MRVVVLVCCLVLLAGCNDQGTGANTGTSSSRDRREATEENRTKTLSTEQMTTATITVPLMPIIGEALRELAALEQSVSQASCLPLWQDAVHSKPVTAKPLAMRCALAMGYHFAFEPILSWPMSPNEPRAMVYASAALAHVVSINNLASVLAAELSPTPQHDVMSAQAELKAWLRARRSKLLRVYTLMAHFYKEPGVIDRSGKTSGVDFSRGAYHLNLSANGTTLQYAGVDWFGNGVISGKRYEIQLATMTDMSFAKKQTVTQSGEHKVGTSVTTNAGVGQ
jgi:hypothetical protein